MEDLENQVPQKSTKRGRPVGAGAKELLNDLQLRRAKPKSKAHKLFDGGGLFLLVSPTGSKLWRYRYWLDGKEKLLALGEYPDTSLTGARNQAAEARKNARRVSSNV